MSGWTVYCSVPLRVSRQPEPRSDIRLSRKDITVSGESILLAMQLVLLQLQLKNS